MSKYSLTSWPEVIVVFHGEYKRTVTHTLKLSHFRAARTTTSVSHRVELKRTHFHEGEVRGAKLVRVDEHFHRSTCVVRTRWGVPLLKRESWQIIINPMQPQFNDEGPVPVGVPGVLVLLPLALPALQFELSLYAGHATRKRPEIQKCPDHMLVSSSLDHTSWGCMQPHTPGLTLFSSLTISDTLFSRFRIPGDDVTVNWSSVQSVFLVRVQPATKRSGHLDWDPSPLPRTREHVLYQATVLHACSLPVVVSQVPFINFCEDFMSITSISITVCSIGLKLFFDLLYSGVKLVPLILFLHRGLIRLHSTYLYDL